MLNQAVNINLYSCCCVNTSRVSQSTDQSALVNLNMFECWRGCEAAVQAYSGGCVTVASDFSCCPHSVCVESEAVHSVTVMLEQKQKVEIKTDDQNDESVINC